MTLSPADGIRQGFQHLLSWIGASFEAATEADMLAALDGEQISQLAADCGLSPHELLALAKAGPHAADEMPRLMQALNIDASEVEFQMRKHFRAMQITCANCGAKEQCRRDLASGQAQVTFASYCGNVDDMNQLRADPRFLVAG